MAPTKRTQNQRTPTQQRAYEAEQARRKAMKEAIAEGRLTVRKMTAAERKAMEAHRAVHGRERPKRRRSSHS